MNRPSIINHSQHPAEAGRAIENEGPTFAKGTSSMDVAWAGRVAARIRGEFGELIASFPFSARRSTGMARWLSLQVPLCHRVLAGIRAQRELSGVFAAFPGIEGLRSFLRAASRMEVAKARLEQCSAAVDELQSLVEHAGGSQRRLVASLEAIESSGPAVGRDSEDEPDLQKRLFLSSAELLGSCSRAALGVRVYTPSKSPAFPGDMDVTATVGRCGFVRTGTSTPFVLSYATGDRPRDAQADGDAPQRSRLLKEFCSLPTPRVTCDVRLGVAIEVVDPTFESTAPMDIFAGPFESSNVIVKESEVGYLNSGIIASHPSERLISDVYLPRSMVGSLECSAGVYHHGSMGGVSGAPSRRWFDRLPLTITPMLLGRGIANSAVHGLPNHTRLTERIFEAAGVDPSGYTGFRMDVAYPLLYAQYLLSFEFGVRN